jgi:hypothetical protein
MMLIIASYAWDRDELLKKSSALEGSLRAEIAYLRFSDHYWYEAWRNAAWDGPSYRLKTSVGTRACPEIAVLAIDDWWKGMAMRNRNVIEEFQRRDSIFRMKRDTL